MWQLWHCGRGLYTNNGSHAPIVLFSFSSALIVNRYFPLFTLKPNIIQTSQNVYQYQSISILTPYRVAPI